MVKFQQLLQSPTTKLGVLSILTTTKLKFQQHLQYPTTNFGVLSNLTTIMVNPATFAVLNYKIGSTFKSQYRKCKVPVTFEDPKYKIGSAFKSHYYKG